MSGFCACDYDPPGLYRDRIVTARKQYVCCECRGPIAPGDRYQYVFGTFAGYLEGTFTYRTCSGCLDGPVAWVIRNCGCYAHERIYEHLEEVFRDYDFQHPGTKFKVGRFLVRMRRRGSA